MSRVVEISIEEFKTRQTSGQKIIFFDVREEWEYMENNIGATNMPLPQIPNRLAELEHLRNEEIIVHCQTGKRAGQACKYLQKQGFTRVISLSGGIEAYLEVSVAEKR